MERDRASFLGELLAAVLVLFALGWMAWILWANHQQRQQPETQVLGPAQYVTREAIDPTYFDHEGVQRLMDATSTTAPPAVVRPPAPRASRGAPAGRVRSPAGGGTTRSVSSTAYCLRGTMANGQQVHAGAVAMNGVPFGSRWRVVETGAVYVVADRIGHSSEFDVWMASCADARRYGRRQVTVERIG